MPLRPQREAGDPVDRPLKVTPSMARVLCGLQHLGLHVFYNVPNDEIYDHENLEASLGGDFGQPAEQDLVRKSNVLIEHARLGKFLKDHFPTIVEEYGVGDYAGGEPEVE